jgi:hypothetical protein
MNMIHPIDGADGGFVFRQFISVDSLLSASQMQVNAF